MPLMLFFLLFSSYFLPKTSLTHLCILVSPEWWFFKMLIIRNSSNTKKYQEVEKKSLYTPKQLSLTLGEHNFRHLPMHEKTLLLSHSVRRWTGEQFSSVPWVMISFKLRCKPVFAYQVPVYIFALLHLHNSPLLFILLIVKWKAVFTLLFSLTWSGWVLPPSYLSPEHFFAPLLTTTL